MNRAERQQLGAVIDEVRAWLNTAQEARHLAEHLPISPPGDPSAELPLLASLSQVEASGDVATAAQLAKTVWFDGRKKLQPAHEAAGRLSTFHSQVKAAQADGALTAFRERLASKATKERKRLQAVLDRAWRSAHCGNRHPRRRHSHARHSLRRPQRLRRHGDAVNDPTG